MSAWRVAGVGRTVRPRRDEGRKRRGKGAGPRFNNISPLPNIVAGRVIVSLV